MLRSLILGCLVLVFVVSSAVQAVETDTSAEPSDVPVVETGAAQETPAPAAESKYAAVILPRELELPRASSEEDVRRLRYLLEDPMVGNYRVDEVRVGAEDAEGAIKKLVAALKARGGEPEVAFFYIAGPGDGAMGLDAAGNAFSAAEFPGKRKIVVRDSSTSADDGSGPRLTVVTPARDESAAVVEFVFEGPCSPDSSPARLLVNAMRGGSDADRNRKITLAEFAEALAEGAEVQADYDLGDMASVEIFAYRTPSEIVEEIGPEESLVLADRYQRQQRWLEALLVLREIKEDKVSDPEYRRISETAQLNLTLEGRYSRSARDENVSRDVKDGLDVIADMLMRASQHYVTEIDNRDLFAGGARNLQLLLDNDSLKRRLLPPEAKGIKEFAYFLRESVDHVYEKEILTDGDFLMRIKRVIMENDATVKLAPGVIVTEFIYGIPAALDPHTDFIPRKAYKEFHDDTVGHFGGLGIEITLEDKILTVVTPLDGTPAAEAGLLPGDRIVAIEGEPTEGLELMEAVLKLRGPVGTQVSITVVHRSDATPVEVTIKRANITLESIKGYAVDPETGEWKYEVDAANKIAYIRMTDFKESTASDLERTVDSLLATGMKGLVLDLRFNHGGLLSSGVKVSDLFLSEGTIVSVRGANSRPVTFKARYFKTFEEFPVVLLMNQQTASAAEIVAGALRDHRRTWLVGTRSFGKGTVQTIYELERGRSALKLTTAKYYTPSGASIHREVYSDKGGLDPDFDVEMSDETSAKLVEVWHLRGLKKDARERLLEVERELAKKNPNFTVADPNGFEDAQLDKALELLRKAISREAEGKKTDKAA